MRLCAVNVLCFVGTVNWNICNHTYCSVFICDHMYRVSVGQTICGLTCKLRNINAQTTEFISFVFIRLFSFFFRYLIRLCVSSSPIDICHFWSEKQQNLITFLFSLDLYTEPIVRNRSALSFSCRTKFCRSVFFFFLFQI